MTINMFRAKVRKLKIGKFRLLRAGEVLEAHDVLVGRDSYDYPAECFVGLPIGKGETVLRLEFEHD